MSEVMGLLVVRNSSQFGDNLAYSGDHGTQNGIHGRHFTGLASLPTNPRSLNQI